MKKVDVEIDILVNGMSVTEYYKNSNVYIEGRKGSEYSIRLKNNSRHKVLAVPSVDGLSIIDGKPASKDSNGYILQPYSQYIIDGWRINNDEVRKFVFSNRKRDTYSSKTGQGTDNLGVIGVAWFREKNSYSYGYYAKLGSFNLGGIEYPYYNDEVRYARDSYSGSPVAVASSGSSWSESLNYNQPTLKSLTRTRGLVNDPVNTIGTDMGDKTTSRVISTSFDREEKPFIVCSIFYYERKELEKFGIIVQSEPKKKPNPFPKDGYCTEV